MSGVECPRPIQVMYLSLKDKLKLKINTYHHQSLVLPLLCISLWVRGQHIENDKMLQRPCPLIKVMQSEDLVRAAVIHSKWIKILYLWMSTWSCPLSPSACIHLSLIPLSVWLSVCLYSLGFSEPCEMNKLSNHTLSHSVSGCLHL